MITVADALDEIADATGLCPDANPTALATALRLANRIERRLILELASDATAHICLPVKETIVTLPDYVEQILDVQFDARPTFYQHSRERYWMADARSYRRPKERVIQDLGAAFATYLDWTGSYPFFAVSDAEEEPGAEIVLIGTDPTARRIHESISIKLSSPDAQPQLTVKKFTGSFSAIRKTPTNGYVHLFAFDPQTNGSIWVSSLAPPEVSPALRRIKVPEAAAADGTGSLFARVSLRHIPHSSPNEVYLIQCREAIYHAAQALEAERDDPAIYERANNRANSQLTKSRRRNRGSMPRARCRFPDIVRDPFKQK